MSRCGGGSKWWGAEHDAIPTFLFRMGSEKAYGGVSWTSCLPSLTTHLLIIVIHLCISGQVATELILVTVANNKSERRKFVPPLEFPKAYYGYYLSLSVI